jgi:hypothetical protein
MRRAPLGAPFFCWQCRSAEPSARQTHGVLSLPDHPFCQIRLAKHPTIGTESGTRVTSGIPFHVDRISSDQRGRCDHRLKSSNARPLHGFLNFQRSCFARSRRKCEIPMLRLASFLEVFFAISIADAGSPGQVRVTESTLNTLARSPVGEQIEVSELPAGPGLLTSFSFRRVDV